jgi:pSer/pThr/pTyr-binding forkhead associated (FHA) protein
MKLILEVRSGPHTGKKIEVASGHLVRIGRTPRADVAFPDDSHMSGVHFAIQSEEKACWVRDYKSTNGTMVNGQKIAEVALREGDRITAGETQFVVQIEHGRAEGPPEPQRVAVTATQSRLLAALRADFQPLFALLDAAREPSVLKVLVESREECQSLFEGPQGDQLAHFAPYLVRLAPDSTLLEALTRQAWGKNWGVYLTSDSPFQEIRKHLQYFLRVTLDGHREVYFRYYDPRVLRLFLPTCLPEEIDQFFGPIRYYLMEDEKGGALLRFSTSGRGAGLRTFPLVPEPPPGEPGTLTEPFNPNSFLNR